MTLTQAVLSFAVVAGLLTLVPGIDTALVLRSSITRTRAYAFATALGISTGAMIWGWQPPSAFPPCWQPPNLPTAS